MCCLLIISFPALDVSADADDQKMTVHFIDVGQGDSILIETPNKENILIDGGPPDASEKVISYLKKQNIKQIDLLVATHPDIDHIGGLVKVIDDFFIKEVWDTGKFYYTRTYNHYFRKINKRSIPLEIVDTTTLKTFGGVSLQVLNANSVFKTNNQSSIALSLTYGTVDFLLMSDVERRQEIKIMQQTDVESEILKVAHHGSDTSSSFAFLQAVDPEVAILSYGIENTYGHPVGITVDKLLDVGATIYSTAKAGNIVVTTDGKTYGIDVSGVGRLISKPIR